MISFLRALLGGCDAGDYLDVPLVLLFLLALDVVHTSLDLVDFCEDGATFLALAFIACLAVTTLKGSVEKAVF